MTSSQREKVCGRVPLDGKAFVNAAFVDAELVYAGGVPPQFDNCTFEDTNFIFESTAAHTLAFLKSMAGPSTNMRSVVLRLISELND